MRVRSLHGNREICGLTLARSMRVGPHREGEEP
jgi:hypothetical protein